MQYFSVLISFTILAVVFHRKKLEKLSQYSNRLQAGWLKNSVPGRGKDFILDCFQTGFSSIIKWNSRVHCNNKFIIYIAKICSFIVMFNVRFLEICC
jgi:hypothetical protein